MKETMILGLDDGPPKRGSVHVVGVIYRNKIIEGILSTRVKKDGMDATQKTIDLVKDSKFNLRCIMIDGIAFGGFNVLDIIRLNKETGLPVMTIMRDLPDMESIEKALSNVKDSKKRLDLIRAAGTIHSAGDIFVQVVGMDIIEAKAILKRSLWRSKIPEPLRLAHMIASGV